MRFFIAMLICAVLVSCLAKPEHVEENSMLIFKNAEAIKRNAEEIAKIKSTPETIKNVEMSKEQFKQAFDQSLKDADLVDGKEAAKIAAQAAGGLFGLPSGSVEGIILLIGGFFVAKKAKDKIFKGATT